MKKSATPLDEEATDTNIKVAASSDGDDKRKKIIRVVLLLGGLYFAYDTLMPTEEVPDTTVAEAPAPPRPKKKRNRPKPPEESPVVEAPPAVEAPVIGPAAEGPAAEVVAPSPDPDLSLDGLTATEPSPAVETTETPISPPGETTTTDQVLENQPPADVNLSVENDMTEQILKDLEKQVVAPKTQESATGPVGPPSYENLGRGLVYNCKDKHWACVDGASYRICQENQEALKSQNKNKECVPVTVYQSDSACTWVQKEKITTNAKTDFCQ